MDAATDRPVVNAEAAGTPFELPGYQLKTSTDVDKYEAEAEARAAARDANERGDNYVLVTVLFAPALFFAGISGRASMRFRSSGLAFVISAVLVIAAVGRMATFPMVI